MERVVAAGPAVRSEGSRGGGGGVVAQSCGGGGRGSRVKYCPAQRFDGRQWQTEKEEGFTGEQQSRADWDFSTKKSSKKLQ